MLYWAKSHFDQSQFLVRCSSGSWSARRFFCVSKNEPFGELASLFFSFYSETSSSRRAREETFLTEQKLSSFRKVGAAFFLLASVSCYYFFEWKDIPAPKFICVVAILLMDDHRCPGPRTCISRNSVCTNADTISIGLLRIVVCH